MDKKQLWLFIAIITIDKNVIHAEPEPFIGARNDPFVTVSKSVFDNKLSPCQSVPIRNVGPHIIPSPYSVTSPISQSCYIEKPTFIAEVTAHTTRYSNPDETYGKVLLLLQQYFTRKDPERHLYDGTLIRPFVSRRIRNELRPNVRITGLLFQNDIALTLSQIKIINTLNVHHRGKRKIISDPSYHWKSHLIAYRFGDNDRYWQDYIRKALRYWEQETCLRFIENKQDDDYLFFTIGSGCYSSVGRLGGSQTISIGYGCETLGIISHELGHALGFWHEQVRPDRDKYVHINLQNAISGTEGNFEKLRSSQLFDMGVPYDLGSIMHYSANTFTKRFLDFTVDPIDVKYRSTIGNRVKPSFTDFKQINLFYCSDRCRITNLRCRHGGYPDPNNCNTCKCPEGLGGRECSDLQYSSCGYEKLASNEWQILEYIGSSNCYWKIYSPSSRIRFELTEVRYKCDPSCEEYVEVKHKSDFQISGFRSCCLPNTAEPTISEPLTSIYKTTRQTNDNFIRRCRCRIIRNNCNYRGSYNYETTYPTKDCSELTSYRFSRRSVYRQSSVKPSNSRSYNYYRYNRRLML
ncbi:Metalloendopeptidase [Dirofilaria immitis]|nr:Metalloendopeptidase [Dirofilaria immitis]